METSQYWGWGRDKQGGSWRGNNHHVLVVTWDHTVNVWENIQNGSLENMDSKCLVIPRADRERVKGLYYVNLHPVVSNRVSNRLEHLWVKTQIQ